MAVEIAGVDLEEEIPLIHMSYWDLIVFFLVLIVGYIVIKVTAHMVKRSFTRAGVQDLAADFAARIVSMVLYVALLGVALGMLGLDIGTAFIGATVVMGLVLGLALGDTISNIAAGFMIAVTKPFKKGDFVTVNGESGEIGAVGISITEMDTPDNKHVVIPNKAVWASNIINFTKNDTRRIDMEVGVSYGTDLDKVIRLTMKILRTHPKVLGDPAPQVDVKEMADSAVILVVRPWVRTPDYWPTFWQLKKSLKQRYDRAGVEIPFPQMDVHMKK